MNHDLFPPLDFRCLQNWANRFVEYCFPGAGIDQITLREYNLWNKEAPELAKAVRLRSKSHPQYLVIIHLSEKYEHHNLREELIRAVHGPTIWDEQAYLDLGINTTFLDCLKRPTISKLCDEMQRFVFWCYGAKQGEYSPETHGYDWPLHADQKGGSWLLYLEASSDGKPHSPFPDRFSPSTSYSGNHTGNGMEFISEIRDIDDDLFVSLEEIEMLNVDTKKLILRFNNNKLTAYRFLFMGIKIIDRTLTVFYDSTLPEDFKDLPLSEKTLFIRPFKNVQYESAVLRMEKLEPIIIDPDLDIVEYKSVVDGVEIIYRLYSRYEFENRTKLNFDIFPVPTVLSTLAATPTFPVPTKLEKLTVTSENEVYFKRSDIEALIPKPVQPDVSPPIPEWHIPRVVKVETKTEPFQDHYGRWFMEFDSKAIAGGETYVLLKELKLRLDAEKWGRVEVLCDAGRLPVYVLFPHNGTLIYDDQLKKLGLPEENANDSEDDDIGEDTGWFRPHPTDPTLYYEKSPDNGTVHKLEYRFIPSSLKKGDDFGKRWVKISDAHRLDLLSDLGHDGGQPASSAEELPGGKVDPAISPLIEWLKPETLNAIHDLWKALSKKQGNKVKQEKANGRKITKWQIGKAELKIFIKSIRAESTLPDYIFNDLTLKYTASREKEGFFCDVVRQMAKKENKRELAAFRDEILYRNIREIMGVK